MPFLFCMNEPRFQSKMAYIWGLEPTAFFILSRILILLKHKIYIPNSRFLLMVATAFSLWYTKSNLVTHRGPRRAWKEPV